jgi:hypothetical protein
MQTLVNCDKYTFCFIKIIEAPKKFKTGRVLYLDLELTVRVLKSQIHLVRQSL